MRSHFRLSVCMSVTRLKRNEVYSLFELDKAMGTAKKVRRNASETCNLKTEIRKLTSRGKSFQPPLWVSSRNAKP